MGCLPRVKKFLCCISLETGGLIVGWFNVIFSFLALFAVITLLSLEVAGHGEYHPDHGIIGGFVALMIFYSIFIIYYLIILMAAIMLIQGTSRRDHHRMVLFLIIMAIGVVLQFIQVLAAGWATLISAIFMACLSAYFFICIYSLYDKVRSETGRAYA